MGLYNFDTLGPRCIEKVTFIASREYIVYMNRIDNNSVNSDNDCEYYNGECRLGGKNKKPYCFFSFNAPKTAAKITVNVHVGNNVEQIVLFNCQIQNKKYIDDKGAGYGPGSYSSSSIDFGSGGFSQVSLGPRKVLYENAVKNIQLCQAQAAANNDYDYDYEREMDRLSVLKEDCENCIGEYAVFAYCAQYWKKWSAIVLTFHKANGEPAFFYDDDDGKYNRRHDIVIPLCQQEKKKKKKKDDDDPHYDQNVLLIFDQDLPICLSNENNKKNNNNNKRSFSEVGNTSRVFNCKLNNGLKDDNPSSSRVLCGNFNGTLRLGNKIVARCPLWINLNGVKTAGCQDWFLRDYFLGLMASRSKGSGCLEGASSAGLNKRRRVVVVKEAIKRKLQERRRRSSTEGGDNNSKIPPRPPPPPPHPTPPPPCAPPSSVKFESYNSEICELIIDIISETVDAAAAALPNCVDDDDDEETKKDMCSFLGTF